MRLGQILLAVTLALCASSVFAQTFTSTPNVAIPDGSRAGVTSTINVPATGNRVASFRLDLRITHGDNEQLDIYLIPPWMSWAGPYTLVANEFSTVSEALNAPFPRGVIEVSTDNRGGGNGDDFGSGAGPYTYARFSAAGDPVNAATQAITAGTRPFTANVYFPEGVDAFEDLYGSNPSGNWTLVVADDTTGSTGTLVSWRITYAAVGANTLYAHLGANNDPGLPVVRGAAGQVLGQFRLDATAAATVSSVVFRESAATNLNGLLTSASLYRDVNADGLLDGGDALLNTAVPAASPNITFNFSQVIAAGAGVDLLLVGTVAASPAPVSMQMEIQAVGSITSTLTEAGLFARRAGPRPFVTSTTFTYRPAQPDQIADNDDTGITRGITVPATTDRINSLRVGMRLNHTYDGDLDFYLLPPGITWNPPYAVPGNGPVITAPPQVIELSTDNGGGGNGWGSNVTSYTYSYGRLSGANDPTWAAGTLVTAGAAPFTAVSQYRVEGTTAWNLMYNGNPSGTWNLIAVDAWGQDVGYLISWQLEYVPITTPQFWANIGNNNMPGLAATTGTAGNVFGQLELSAYFGANSVTQIVARETNSFTIGSNLSAIALYRDVNANGLFDSGTDTLVANGVMAGATATFTIGGGFNVASGTTEFLLFVGTVLASPANTVLTLQHTTNADIAGSTSEIAPYALQYGAHPLNPPNTYVSTPPLGKSIPDNNAFGITDTITIPATNDLIGALRIGIRIDHANDADLDIWLIPPGVTWAGPYTVTGNGPNVTPPAGVIELTTDNGGTGNDYGTGAISFVYSRFSRNGDRQFNTGNTPVTGGAVPFTAATGYIEEGTAAFNAMYGQSPVGNWTIAIADDAGGGTGRLISWFVQYVPAERAQVFSTPTIGVSDFGNVIVGSPSAAQGFRVQNMGNFSLTLPAPAPANGIRITGTNAADFVIQGVAPSGVLAAGASTATFNIVFTPGALGLRTANITVTWNNSDATMPPQSTSNYAIQGTGVQPLIEVREVSVGGVVVTNGQAAANGRAFGNQDISAGATAALTIVVRNTGGATMTVGLPTLAGANPGDFVLNTAGYLASIPIGSSTSFTVAFDPTVTGVRGATVTFTHNGANTASPFTFGVSGTGTTPAVEVHEVTTGGTLVTNGQTAANGRAFGSRDIAAGPSATLTIFVLNTGTASMTLGTPALGGTNPGEFVLNTSGFTPTVAAGANTSFTLAFDPSVIGARSATVSFTHTGSNTATPFTFALSGIGTTPTIVVREVSTVGTVVTNGQAAANGRAFGSRDIVSGPSATLSIFVLNTGSAPMTVSLPSLGGVDASQFVLNTAGYTLAIAAGGNTSFTLAFDPSMVGAKAASISFTHTGSNTTTPFTFSLSGTGTTPAVEVREVSTVGTLVTNGQAAANGRAFGNRAIAAGPSATLSVFVLNTGSATMTLALPVLGGVDAGQFVLNTTGFALSLAPATNTSFTIAFDPSTVGVKAASISFSHTGTNTATPFTFSLSGNGTTPGVEVREVSTVGTLVTNGQAAGNGRAFGNRDIAAGPGATLSIFVLNTGTATLTIGVPALGGVDAGQFILNTTGFSTSLAPAASTSFTLAFDPTSVGAKSATVNFTHDGSNTATPFTFSLSGTGEQPAVTVASSGSPSETGPTAGTFTITGAPAPGVARTVNFTMSGLADVAVGVDYTLSGADLISYAAGSGTLNLGVSGSASITLTPNNDAAVEALESATITIVAGANYTVGAPSATTLNIIDNDAATIALMNSGSPSEAPANGTYTISTPQTLEVALTVNFTVSGVAVAADYTLAGTAGFAFPNGSVTLGPGVAPSINVTLTPVNDLFVEGPETAIMTITGGTQYTGTPNTTLTIGDNDTATVTMSAAGAPNETGPVSGTFTITVTPQPQHAMSVNISLSGAAQFGAGFDYTISGAAITTPAGGTGPWVGTVNVPGGGGAFVSVNVTLNTQDDTRVEATEIATLAVTADSVATDPAYTGTPSQLRNILDNDTASVSVTSTGTAAEPGTAATYTIQSGSTLETPVTVSFNMSGSAQTSVGGDYNLASAGGSFTGPGGTAILPVGTNTQIIVTLTPVNDAIVEATETATLTVLTAGQVTAAAPTNATLNITDDDTVTVSVTSVGAAAEPATAASYTIQGAGTLETPVTVSFTMSGTAGNGVDYTLTGTGILPVGTNTQAFITLNPIDELRVEATETAQLTLNAGAQVSVGAPGNATLNLTDNDTATVNVSFAGSPGETGPTGGTFTLSTAATLDVALVVSFAMSGTADAADYGLGGATSYTFPNGTATLPVGVAPNVVVTLTPVDDVIVEGTETATLTISGGGQVVVGTALQTHNIIDNDTPIVTVTAGGSPAEGGAGATFTIATSATLGVALTVNFTLSGLASTINGTDYTLAGFATYAGPTGTATLSAGVAPSVNITLAIFDDAFVEGPEDAILTLNAGLYTIGGAGFDTRTIADNDTATISVTLGGSPSEAPANGTYTITATPAPVRDMLVDFAMSGSASFAAGGDYTLSGTTTFSQASGLGTVTIGVGGSTVVTLAPVNDAIVEAGETATLTVTPDSVASDPAYTGTPAQTHTIADNDSVTVTVTSSGSPSESGATGTYTIQSASTLETPVTVTFAMSGVAGNGVDYNLSGTGTLPVGTNTQAIITLTPVNDARVEAIEDAILTLNAGAQVTVGAPASASLNILDDDIATVTVSTSGTPTESGSVSAIYTLSTTDILDVPVTVSFLMSGAASTAPGTDYTLSGSYTGPGGSAVLPVGTGSSVNVTLTPIDDARVEANEAATLTVQTVGQAQAGVPAAGTLNITDNDVAVITVTPSGSPSESGATGTYLVATGATLEIALTVNFTMSGVAVNADYALAGTASFAFPSGSVTLPIGTGSSALVTLTPANDAIVEGPEDATLTVTAGAQYSGTPFGTLTIADNDTVVITLSTLSSPSEAGPTAATFRITATPQPAIAMSVNVSLSGSATFGGGFDYTVSGATISTGAGGPGPWIGTVNIPGGGAGSTFVDVTITPVDDARVEATESVNLDVTADTLFTDPDYSGTPSTSLNITDNDTASVSVTSSGVAAEPGTSATFIIQSASIIDVPVTVTFTMSGSAQTSIGGDYNLSSAGGTFTGPGGTAILPVGTNTQITVTLSPVNDAIVEATETAILTVLTAGQVTAASPVSDSLNITDDDTATVNVSFAGSPSETGPTSGTFTFSTSATLEVALSVNFSMSGAASTVPGTDYNISSAGGSYTGPAGTALLPIGAAPSVVITLAPIDDMLVEGGETATLTISGGGQVVVGTALQTHTIADNDTPTVTVTASGTPAESGGGGTFTIATAATLAVPLTVNFTMSGLAFSTSGTDYTLAGFATYPGPSGTVTLPAGAAPSMNVTFSVVNDTFVEGPESVIMTLNAGLYTVGGAGFDTLSIADNDTATVTMTSSGSPHETGPVNGTYSIIVTPQPRNPMSVNISLTGTAQFGAAFDYNISGASISTAPGGSGPWLGTVSVPTGTGISVSVLVTLQTQDDAAAEPTESATLTVTADSVATDPAYSGTPAQTLNILDNDLPVISIVGGPLSFGGAEIGTASAPQSYSVSAVNLTANLVITPPVQFEVALAAGGPWLSVLNLVPSSGTVASTAIFVHFAPSTLGAAVGNVSNASAGAATQDVAVSGIGTGITASAASLVFGNQLVGTASATQTYTVQAEGLSANLLISAPAGFELSTTGGAPWFASLNLGTGTIAPTLISVRFVPLATGAAGGNVSNISTGFVTRDVSVSGNGVAGVLNIAGTQNHGSVPVTQNGAAILYTISNVAAGPTAASLTVNSVTLGGANPGDFALSAFSVSLPTVLAPGTSFTFLGTFTPLTQGVRNADIVINSNTGGEPPSNSVYPITGTGTAGLFAATPTFPAQIDNGGPVVVSCVISALANTTADIMVEYIGGSVAVWTPAVLVRTNAGSISGNVITGMSVLAAGSTLEIFWDAYASERHITAANYQIRFTPSNGIYGTGTIGTSVTFSLARDGGWAKHSIPVDYLTGRIGQSSVFDAANDRLVVFAGAAEFMQLNDVWAYDRSGYAQGWHRINAAGTPPAARQYPVSVYDAANQRMLVFGGWNSSLGVFNDTWSLSLTRGSETWAQLAPAGGLPAARHFHAAALDLARNRMLMFGGKGASGNLGDIWELTLNLGTETWTQLAPTGTAPTARNGAQMVVDVPRDRLVIYGGDTGVNVSSTEVFALSLATPPGAWSNLLPATPQGAPVGRHMAAYGYCDNRQSMLVVAGYRTGGAFNTDSWLLDLNGSPTWTPLSADPDALQGRCHGTTGYDAARGQLMVFGGINKYAKIQDSLSILDTNATPSWQTPPSQSALADTPGQRNTQSMVFDTRFAPNGRVVVFGGNNLSNSYNDVWYLDPSLASPTWIKLNPSGTPPSPRGMCAVAYDNTAGSEKMIVFGGVDYNGVANNEVWILDLSNPGAESWSKVVVAGGPTPRTRATAVVDPNGGSPRLLVFGGDGSGRRNDVWSLNLTGSPSWTLLLVLTGPSPAPRFGHGMTLDSAGNRLIIYYGNCAGGFLQDTWAFNLTLHTWTDITQTVGSKPTGRENFPTASALAGTRAYLHAGLSGSNVSDLWRLDVPPSGTVTWTQVNFTGAAPLARHHHSVCIDSTGRLISGFGYVAIAANKAAADIWAIDPLAGSPAWQQLQTSSEPRGSQHAASGLDAANGRMIVFGGLLGGVLDGRLWQLSLNSPIAAWSELNAGGAKPAPRRSAKFVYDPVGNRMLMYGGYVGSYYQSISDEMWQLTLTPGFETWTQLSLGGGPPGLADYSVVYDPVSHSAVYFGGQLNTGGGNNGLWRLALGSMTWSTSTATTKPVARYGHSAIYDSVSARMIMFAGKYGGTDGVNDLWSYNIAADSWTQLAVAGAPGGRYFHSAVFDSTPGQERMIVFCGFSNGARSDAWTLDLRSGFPLAWNPLTSTVALPQPRWAHNAVFDAANLRMVLAGGYTNGEEVLQEDGKRADTWFYGR